MRPSLTRQLTISILAYTLVLSALIALHGYFVNERAEQLTWESLLESELRHFAQRRADDPGYRWMDTDVLKLYGQANQRPIPSAFEQLEPGVHDEVRNGPGEYVVLVSGPATDRTVMALDIAMMERSETRTTWLIVASSLSIIVVLTLIAHLGLRRLVRPLGSLAHDIGLLRPDRSGQQIAVDSRAPSEAVTIAAALNGYLERLDKFVEREAAFVTMASHELRTPIAVIASTAEVALGSETPNAPADRPLQHILNTARDMEKLTTLLLALARDPARLRAGCEVLDLADLLPGIVENYRGIAAQKELSLLIDPLPSCLINAPRPIAAAAIGNLLRNAIENSDRGTITLTATADGTVQVADPGHGMSAEEISAIYTQMARSDSARAGGGIGIALVARLCEHLGWRLNFTTQPERGTVATLHFSETAAGTR